MSDQFFLIGLVVVAYLLAGSVKGVIGMGLPTVAIAILASVMSPAKAAAILIAPSLFTNVWQMLVGPYLARARPASRPDADRNCGSAPGRVPAFSPAAIRNRPHSASASC